MLYFLKFLWEIVSRLSEIAARMVMGNVRLTVVTAVWITLMAAGIWMCTYSGALVRTSFCSSNRLLVFLFIILTFGIGTIILAIAIRMEKNPFVDLRGKTSRSFVLINTCWIAASVVITSFIDGSVLASVSGAVSDRYASTTWALKLQFAFTLELAGLILTTVFRALRYKRYRRYLINASMSDDLLAMRRQADSMGRKNSGDMRKKDISYISERSAPIPGLRIAREVKPDGSEQYLYYSNWDVVDMVVSVITVLMIMVALTTPYLITVIDKLIL